MDSPTTALKQADDEPASPTERPGLPEAEIVAVKAHPRFPEACRQAALSGLKLYRGNRLLNTLVNDRGRSSIGLLALYLHYERRPEYPRSGLTLSRLKAICADQNIGSPGRIEAVVMLMRVFGFLQQKPSTADQRVRHLVPTERLISTFNERWKGLLAAMAQVMPEAETIRKALNDEAFDRAFVRRLAEHFLAGVRPMDDPRARELFGDRNAGLMVVFSLMTAGGPDNFPPRTPVGISISALARHFGVSRVHVRKLLRDAVDAGYLARPDGEDATFIVLPTLHAVVENFFANAFLFMRDAGQSAFAEVQATRKMAIGERA